MGRKGSVISAIVFLLLVAGLFGIYKSRQNQPEQTVQVSPGIQNILSQTEEAPSNQTQQTRPETTPEATPEPGPGTQAIPADDSVTIKGQTVLSVPFIVQAPFAQWVLPYKEACEEASVMTVDQFYQGKRNLSEQEMKDAIDSIIFWGDDTFHTADTTAAETARYFTEKLGYDSSRVHVIYNFSIEDIKALLSQGIPVIIPAAGRELGNPHFQTPGPLYHMLVIIGYDSKSFITNDPGTKYGAGFRYDQQALYNAIHDLTPDINNISSGRKAMLVVTP